MKIVSEKVEFTGHDGKSRLAARLDTPEGGATAVALFAHCFACSKESHAAHRIAAALAAKGYAVLRFDFTGIGGSEGEFANTDFSSNIEDLVAAGRFLAGRGQAPQVLIGHSLGGAAVLAAAGRIGTVKAVASIGAPADPAHVGHLFRDDTADIQKAGRARVEVAGRHFSISKAFLDDITEHNLLEQVGKLRCALLLFHAPTDNVVGIENASRIFAAARHPKSFVSLDDADHLLTRRADAAYVADVLAAWAERYIDAGVMVKPGASAPDIDVPEGWGVAVAETAPGPYTQTVNTGRHVLIADEPEKAGGTDMGPNPHRFLLAALGSCTSMTLRMYVRRKEWDVGRISVFLRHGLIDREDPRAGQRIERRIAVDGPLSDEQREKLVEIANRCPVHRTLTGKLEIATEMAD